MSFSVPLNATFSYIGIFVCLHHILSVMQEKSKEMRLLVSWAHLHSSLISSQQITISSLIQSLLGLGGWITSNLLTIIQSTHSQKQQRVVTKKATLIPLYLVSEKGLLEI